MATRRRGTHFGVLLLGAELLRFGVDRVPPVTLGTIALNVLVYLYLPLGVRDTCMSWQNVWNQWDLKRLIIGSIDHADDIHLYYNMVSFLMKGTSLEKRFKSHYFAYVLIVFTTLTSVLLLGLNVLLAELTHDQFYLHQCAVGFSGVIFALKVLTTHYNPPGTQRLLGFIPVPSKWVYWAELVLIQIIVPNASFTGHLAGILVGLAYIKGPLKHIMNMFIPSAPSYSYRAGRSGHTNDWSSTGFTTGYRSSNDSSRPNPSAPFEDRYASNSGWTSGSTRYRGASAPSPPTEDTTNWGQSAGGTGAPPPPGWHNPGQRLYPDLGTETDVNMTEEEQMRVLLERSKWQQ